MAVTHSLGFPRIGAGRELKRALEACWAGVIPAERLWVNPDCGLKTRGWPETEQALARMVEAAKAMRERTPLGARPVP